MKMVKSLLLVSAAGLVATAGAQAADLPVKAKPVEYVKVCSLYGAGFYYIPGTDICLKVGAYFRAEYAFGNQASSLTNLDNTGVDGQRTRITGPDYQQRARAFIFLDSRQQTAYGTLRAYMNIGWTDDFPNGQTAGGTSAAGVYANRAFMQLAGFTWGVATSYYDFFSSPCDFVLGSVVADTGDGGWKVAAYTAQLGNGVSASFSVEEPRRQDVVNTSFNDGCAGAFNANAPRQLPVRQPVYRRRVADAGHRQDRVAGPRGQRSRRSGLGFRPAHGCGPSGRRRLLRRQLAQRASRPAIRKTRLASRSAPASRSTSR